MVKATTRQEASRRDRTDLTIVFFISTLVYLLTRNLLGIQNCSKRAMAFRLCAVQNIENMKIMSEFCNIKMGMVNHYNISIKNKYQIFIYHIKQ